MQKRRLTLQVAPATANQGKRQDSLSQLARQGLILAAKDFWQKPFTEWNEQEALKMLSESPWARTQTVVGGMLGAGQSTSNRATDLPNVATAESGRSAGTVLGRAGVGIEANDSVPLYVRWFSSVRIRQALGRLGQLQNNVPEAEVKKFTEQPMDEYLIAVAGPLLNTFNELSLEDFKPKTFLISKKDKAKRFPLKNYVAPKDRSDGVAMFSFPRQSEGKPAFGPEDQEVEFVAQGRKVNLKVSFKLAKVMTDGKLDL